jgi:hypothetical protein
VREDTAKTARFRRLRAKREVPQDLCRITGPEESVTQKTIEERAKYSSNITQNNFPNHTQLLQEKHVIFPRRLSVITPFMTDNRILK